MQQNVQQFEKLLGENDRAFCSFTAFKKALNLTDRVKLHSTKKWAVGCQVVRRISFLLFLDLDSCNLQTFSWEQVVLIF